jgi:hypothetical protein
VTADGEADHLNNPWQMMRFRRLVEGFRQPEFNVAR